MFDDFDFGFEREPYENDLEDLSNREAWEDEQYEREDHNWDERDELDPEFPFEAEDRYLDSAYEDRYYQPEGGYDYL